MSDTEQQEPAEPESPPIQKTPTRKRSSKPMVVGIFGLLFIFGVFLFVRSEDRHKVGRLLVSNASADQQEGVKRVLRNPGRYQPVWEKLVLDRLDLGGLLYSGVEFRRCDFSGGRFDGSQFKNCRFIDCNFALSDMRQTVIRDSVFSGCNFAGSDFDGATIEGVDISLASFKGSNISAEQVKGTQGWDTAIFDDNLQKELALMQ